MTRPEVTATTERVYASLPEAFRDADATLPDGGGYPLLRYLSLTTDQAGRVEALIDRLDGDGGPVELLDPRLADEAWLPWLAQLLGVTAPPGQPLTRERFAGVARQRGSRAALRAAITNTMRPDALGAPPRVLIDVDPNSPFVLAVTTYTSQTPDPAALAAGALGEKPAGIGLTYTVREGIRWDDLPALAVTWDHARAIDLTWTELGAAIPAHE